MISDKNQVIKIDGKFVYFKQGEALPESKQIEKVENLVIIEDEKELLEPKKKKKKSE